MQDPRVVGLLLVFSGTYFFLTDSTASFFSGTFSDEIRANFGNCWMTFNQDPSWMRETLTKWKCSNKVSGSLKMIWWRLDRVFGNLVFRDYDEAEFSENSPKQEKNRVCSKKTKTIFLEKKKFRRFCFFRSKFVSAFVTKRWCIKVGDEDVAADVVSVANCQNAFPSSNFFYLKSNFVTIFFLFLFLSLKAQNL